MTATTRFRVGDRVRCVSAPGTGQLAAGEVYEVRVALSDGPQLIALNKWPLMLWNADRFELAPKPGSER